MAIPKHIEYARELRKRLTPEERIVWEIVRNRRLRGYKFLRQHPVIVGEVNGRKEFYIADFYCAERRLVLEIDGSIHIGAAEYDKARDIVMNEMGLTVLRFTNSQVKAELENVLKIINDHLM